MKVLLIFPPLTMHRLDVSGAQRGLLMGLAYIASVLKQAGHEVKLLNCRTAGLSSDETSQGQAISPDFIRYGISDELIKQEIIAFKPDVAGISCTFTSYFKDAHHVAQIVKAIDPMILVIFGGAHTSTFPDVVMKDANVDIAVIGEGETTIREILEHHSLGQPFTGVKGIMHRSSGMIIREEAREFIQNLDDIPFPAWDLMEHDIEMVKNDHKSSRYLMRPPVGYILTSRGCPKECYFCSVKLTWARKWRARSAKNIVDEIEFLKAKYGYREFHFVDDNSSVSKQRMHEICDEIISRKLNIKIATPTGIAIGTLDKDLLSHMKKAGFYRLCFGLESGDPETQQIIKKRINLQKAKEVITDANRLGFWTSGTFIMGFPHETRKEIQKTIDFTKASDMDFPVIYLLTPQPGTEVYTIFKEQGLIDLDGYLDPHSDEWWKISITYCNGFKNKALSNNELQSILSSTYREFVMYKLFRLKTYVNLVRKIRSWEDLRYLVKLMAIPLNMIIGLAFGKNLSNKSFYEKRGGRQLESVTHLLTKSPENPTCN